MFQMLLKINLFHPKIRYITLYLTFSMHLNDICFARAMQHTLRCEYVRKKRQTSTSMTHCRECVAHLK